MCNHNLQVSSIQQISQAQPQLWRLPDHLIGLEARLAMNSRCPRILWGGGIEELPLQLADLPHVPWELLQSHCTAQEPTKAPQTSSFRLHITLLLNFSPCTWSDSCSSHDFHDQQLDCAFTLLFLSGSQGGVHSTTYTNTATTICDFSFAIKQKDSLACSVHFLSKTTCCCQPFCWPLVSG
jgi:hypothetical protein